MRRQPRHRSTGINTLVTGALRALSISTPTAFVNAPATPAQAVEHEALAGGIPAQPRARALEALASQTGLQIVYVSGWCATKARTRCLRV